MSTKETTPISDNCPKCGNPIPTPRHANRRFCSKVCRDTHWNHKRNPEKLQQASQARWANMSEENKLRERSRQRIDHANLRLIVISAYGGACSCCGETTVEFLAIDHVNGGGNQHRKETNLRSRKLYSWIIKNGFPKDFRLLCHNCNSSLGLYGYCPHADVNAARNIAKRGINSRGAVNHPYVTSEHG